MALDKATERDVGVVAVCLEQLCAHGCRQVDGFIEALTAGRSVPGTEHLSLLQRRLLLHEMQSIMAVYAERGGCGLG